MAAAVFHPECRNGLTQECREMPVCELPPSIRNTLSSYLSHETSAVTTDDVSKDYRGLAELMNISNRTIQSFVLHRNGPMEALLEHYEKEPCATVGKLWDYITELERHDIIENEDFIKRLNNQVQKYQDRLKENEQRSINGESKPTGTDNTLQSAESMVDKCDELHTASERNKAHCLRDPHYKEKIHVFVSYCQKDLSFVIETLKPVAEAWGITLYIRDIDLIPGEITKVITAEMMAQRCHKVLMIITPDYLLSDDFRFQSNIALCLENQQRFIIPLLLKPTPIPLVFRPICPVDYTREDIKDYFWERLKSSLQSEYIISNEDMAKLKTVDRVIDLDKSAIPISTDDRKKRTSDSSAYNTKDKTTVKRPGQATWPCISQDDPQLSSTCSPFNKDNANVKFYYDSQLKQTNDNACVKLCYDSEQDAEVDAGGNELVNFTLGSPSGLIPTAPYLSQDYSDFDYPNPDVKIEVGLELNNLHVSKEQTNSNSDNEQYPLLSTCDEQLDSLSMEDFTIPGIDREETENGLEGVEKQETDKCDEDKRIKKKDKERGGAAAM